MERCHEQRHRSDAFRLSGKQGQIIESVFQDRLFYRNYRCDDWLGLSLRLDHLQGSKLAVGLVQISDQLSELCYSAADHDPERKVYFQRDSHRASPHF